MTRAAAHGGTNKYVYGTAEVVQRDSTSPNAPR